MSKISPIFYVCVKGNTQNTEISTQSVYFSVNDITNLHFFGFFLSALYISYYIRINDTFFKQQITLINLWLILNFFVTSRLFTNPKWQAPTPQLSFLLQTERRDTGTYTGP